MGGRSLEDVESARLFTFTQAILTPFLNFLLTHVKLVKLGSLRNDKGENE